MSERITIEALSVASFAAQLSAMPHETRAVVTATMAGAPWAHVQVSPSTDTMRAAFPVDAHGVRGDTSKRGQAGVMFRSGTDELRVVIERARRMANR